MSQRDRAQARQLNIDFTARPDSGPSHSGGRGFSIGRDTPHGQQLSAPPMNAAQAAQQRRQVQTDQREESKRRKQFVTGLSDSNGTSGQTSATASGRHSPEPSASGFSTPRDDVDDATATRHAALLSRVSMLVGDSPTKLASFRSAVRQFKNNESSAKDMVDTLFHVLDQDRESTSGVAREIAKLFDSEGEQDKQRAVLEAVNGFHVEVSFIVSRTDAHSKRSSSLHWAALLEDWDPTGLGYPLAVSSLPSVRLTLGVATRTVAMSGIVLRLQLRHSLLFVQLWVSTAVTSLVPVLQHASLHPTFQLLEERVAPLAPRTRHRGRLAGLGRETKRLPLSYPRSAVSTTQWLPPRQSLSTLLPSLVCPRLAMARLRNVLRCSQSPRLVKRASRVSVGRRPLQVALLGARARRQMA